MMKKSALYLCLLFCIHHVGAVPAQIVVVRHANKNLKVEEATLTMEGRVRAAGLGILLAGSPALTTFGPPAAIFATHTAHVYHTVRTIQTMLDLSRLTKIEIETPYILTETKELAAHVLSNPKYANQYVVICWDYRNIPHLLKALGVKEDVPEVAEDVFDRMWILQYAPDGTLKSFQNTSQRLLFGDSAQ